MNGRDALNSQYKKGVLELCVLSLLKKRDCYGYEISEFLSGHIDIADGYSEEEIAAKLGAPKDLASQFDPAPQKKLSPSRFFTIFGLCWLDLFYGIFVVLLFSWGIVMASLVISFGLSGVCLIGHLDCFPLVSLPSMPYASALLLGLALAALTIVCVIGSIYYFAFMRQLMKAYARFHQNTLASSKGKAALPPLPIHPQFSAARKRHLRTALLVSFVCFGVFFVLGFALSTILAGQFEFWHAWHWFGYGR